MHRINANWREVAAARIDAARVEADLTERRTNTRDRLNRLDRTGDGPFHRDAAINWLAWEMPDLLNEALDNTGAPE